MRVTATKLNVRSGPGTTFRVLGSLKERDEVEVLERNGDWAWVLPGSGWVHYAYLATSSIGAPHGIHELIARFGEPGSAAASAGRVRFPAPLKLGYGAGFVSQAPCHIKLEQIFTAAFQEIKTAGLWHLLRTFDGIYNPRKKTGTSEQWSTHAWGIAVDLNAASNAYGTRGNMDPRIIAIFAKHGFTHLKNDPMHFQFVTGY